MLQPRQTGPEHQLTVSRILWAGLTSSMVIYGLVLFTTGKVSGVFMPETELLPIEIAALSMNFLSLFVFWFYKNNIATVTDIDKRMTGQIICWALNESVVIMGFVAVFLTDKGNAFIYLTNLLVGLASNVLTFPRK